MNPAIVFFGALLSASCLFAQTKESFDNSGDTAANKGILDKSRLTVSHAMNFGMLSGGGYSSLQSQSLYSTMMQYKFTAPVTLNLNFGLPIFSSFSPYQNLTTQNLQSLNYFKSIPFDVSLCWKPSDRMQFNISVVNYPTYGMYGNDLLYPTRGLFYRPGFGGF
jgi:hypothetical protein